MIISVRESVYTHSCVQGISGVTVTVVDTQRLIYVSGSGISSTSCPSTAVYQKSNSATVQGRVTCTCTYSMSEASQRSESSTHWSVISASGVIVNTYGSLLLSQTLSLLVTILPLIRVGAKLIYVGAANTYQVVRKEPRTTERRDFHNVMRSEMIYTIKLKNSTDI